MSKRTTQRLLDDLLGVPMSLGPLRTREAATTQAVAGPVEAARAYVQAQGSGPLDATSWRAEGKRAWMWGAVTTGVTVGVVRLSRGGQGARERLGESLGGSLVPDRWRASNWYPVRWRQLCGAHVRRDIEAMIARGGASQDSGAARRSQGRQMLPWWHRVRDGPLKRASFRSSRSPVRREVERLVDAGSACGVAKTAGRCRDILTLRQALGTCGHLEGVEPTHNAAERARRPGVRWRKGRLGTQSAQGSRFVEAMLTVVATLKQQHRNVLAYMTDACQAAYTGLPAPSLLPQHPEAEADLPGAA